MPVELAAQDLDRFVGVAEAALRLGIHPDTARRWIRNGRWQREFPGIPIQTVGGKQQISLRLVVELVNTRSAA